MYTIEFYANQFDQLSEPPKKSLEALEKFRALMHELKIIFFKRKGEELIECFD